MASISDLHPTETNNAGFLPRSLQGAGINTYPACRFRYITGKAKSDPLYHLLSNRGSFTLPCSYNFPQLHCMKKD